MKQYEKESLSKSFLIFFISLELLNIIIFSFYYKEQKDVLTESIFSILKEYNYKFENPNVSMDVVDYPLTKDIYKLYIDKKEVYAYFTLLDSKHSALKLSYDFTLYQQELDENYYKILGIFIFISFILLLYSFLYSLYALRPYKSAIELLERFLKDIIHDLNTPVSSILINSSILKKRHDQDAVHRIELSAKTISNLYKNLEIYINESAFDRSKIDIGRVMHQRVDYFGKLFPKLSLHVKGKSFEVATNEIAITRIFDNIISNACKYNRKNGSVEIVFENKEVIIKDSGYGMKEPQKAFERFYKESERGMGIGLNIVEKLATELDVTITLKSEIGVGTEVRLDFRGVK